MFGVDDMIVGGISGVGSVVSSLINKSSQEDTNRMNAEQAYLNRQFQADMSNTAYQRGMADMKSAGLNPILAYQKGGASTPSGAQATMVAPKLEGNPIGDAVNTALAMRQKHLEAENLRMTNFNIQEDTALKAANAAKAVQDTQLAIQQQGIRSPEAIRAKADAEILGNSAVQIARKAGTAAEEGARVVGPIADSVGRVIGSATGLNKMVRGSRSTSETTTTSAAGGGSSSFTERFHY